MVMIFQIRGNRECFKLALIAAASFCGWQAQKIQRKAGRVFLVQALPCYVFTLLPGSIVLYYGR